MRGLRLTIILLAIALLAVSYFFLVEQPRHKTRVAEEENRERLTQVTPPEVFGLHIQRPDVDLEFERTGTEWRMVAPVADLADQSSIATLVLTVLTAKIDQQFAADTDALAQYGLSDPAAVVTFKDSLQNNLIELEVGDFNLGRSDCYAREKGSQDVLLLPSGVRRYSLREMFEFRDKKVTDFDVDSATAIEIVSGGRQMTWERLDEGQWITLVRGDTIVGDPVAVEAVLRELRGLRAKSIVEDDPSNRARYFPLTAGRINVRFGNDTPIGFVFSEPDTGWCFVRNDTSKRIVGVAATAVDVFARKLPDFRDRRVLHFDRDALATISFRSGSLDVSIRKMGDQWSFSNPSYGDIDEAAVTTFINELENLKYREIIEERLTDPASYGLDPPVQRIGLLDGSGTVMDELRAGTDEPNRRIRYVTSRSSKHLGIVDDEPFVQIERLFRDFQLQ